MATDYARRLFTVDEFLRMYETNILDRDERLELLDGELLLAAPMKPPHSSSVECVMRVLVRSVGDIASVRCRVALPLPPRSYMLPDFVVARSERRFYADRHPSVDEVFWVIELGDSTNSTDRRLKLPIYARARVREVWLIDIARRRLSTFAAPNDLGYAEETRLGPGDVVRARALPDVEFAVRDLFVPD